MGTIHSISRKNCFISYSAVALKEPVQICRTPLIKDCNVQGPEICRSEQEWDRRGAGAGGIPVSDSLGKHFP